jgi:hypothetical protein
MSPKITRFCFLLVPCLFVSFCVLALSTPGGAAQDLAAGTAKTKTEHQTLSVTGCLQKGKEPGGFFITAEDGKTWELFGHSVKLDKDVGHKVTLTGYQIHRSKAAEAQKAPNEKDEAAGKDYADMNVTGLKMISETCSQ